VVKGLIKLFVFGCIGLTLISAIVVAINPDKPPAPVAAPVSVATRTPEAIETAVPVVMPAPTGVPTSSESDRLQTPISRDSYGSEWPFTVDQGILVCDPGGIHVLVFVVGRKIYALNGTAKDRMKQNDWASIDEIMIPDETTKGAWKYSPNPIIAIGLKPCPQASEMPSALVLAAPVATNGIGDRVVSGGIALTILKVRRVSRSGIFRADSGNEFVVLDVLIENVERDEAPYNPFYFKVKDSENFEYDYSIASPNPSLKSGDLKRGGKARGNVAFEVKKGAKGLVVSYEPLVLFGGYETISIGLE
jgi:hypothetical protein